MKLSHDCVRDLLLAVENNNSRTAWIPIERIAEREQLFEKGYTLDDLEYTAECLSDAGYIIANITFEGGAIQRLTMSGHELLDNIRDPLIWTKAKEISSNLASVSVRTLFELGVQLVRKSVGID